MKKFTLLILLAVVGIAYAQQPAPVTAQQPIPYPRSIVELGVGTGYNFGIVGAQAVVGYKGCGLLAAVGGFRGVVGLALGAQFSYKWFYLSIAQAVIGSQRYNTGSSITVKQLTGTVFVIGGKLNLSEKKLWYLKLGLGYAIEASEYHYPVGYTNPSGATAEIGLGWRIPFKN